MHSQTEIETAYAEARTRGRAAYIQSVSVTVGTKFWSAEDDQALDTIDRLTHQLCARMPLTKRENSTGQTDPNSGNDKT